MLRLHRRTPEERFWQWFVKNEEEFWNLSPDESEARERSFERLETELHKIDSNLTFEFGHGMDPRDFVISAGGIRDSFPAVVKLCDTAPKLSHWNIIAFRPRRGERGIIRMDGVTIRGDDLAFTLLDNGETAGLRLFLPGYIEENSTMKSIAYLFLDEALGEHNVETGLTFLEFHATEDVTEGERFPFSELPKMFDKLMIQLKRTSGTLN